MNSQPGNVSREKVIAKESRLYHQGPNFTADAVVTRKNNGVWEILLVQRPDGSWAFPAGFRDPVDEEGTLEDPEETIVRETEEETGIAGLGTVPKTKVYEGKVEDPRNEEGERWIETTAYHMDVTGLPNTEPKETSDVYTRQVKWFAMQDVPQPLYGSHSQILETVKQMYDF